MSSIHQLLQEGLSFHERGLLAQAEQRYRRILSIEPQNGWAHHFLAAIAQECEQHEAAIHHFSLSLQEIPDNAAAWNGVGRSLLAQNKLSEAKKMFLHAIARNSSQGNFYNNLGNTLHLLGELHEAKDAFLKAVEYSPSLVEAQSNLGKVYIALAEWSKAYDTLRMVVRQDPNHAAPWSNLGIVCAHEGDMEQAEEAFLKAYSLEPNNNDCRYNWAQFLHKKGEYSTAKQMYQEIIQSDVHREQVYIQLSYLHTDIDLRLQVLQDGFSCNPQSIAIGRALSHAYMSIDAPSKAEKICRQLLQNHPEQEEIRLELIRTLLGQNKLSAAHQLFEECRSKTELYFSCLLSLYRLQEDWEMAVEVGKEGVIAYPNSVELYNGLGVLFAERGMFTQAKEAYEKALAIQPQNPSVKRHLTLIHSLDRADILELEEYFHNEENPRMLRIHAGFALATALDSTKEYEKASTIFIKANNWYRETFSYSVVLAGLRLARMQEIYKEWSIPSLESEWEGPMPIFVMGLPRSGSTLVEQILSAHSDVDGVGEVRYLLDCVEVYGQYPECLSSLTSEDLQNIRSAYLQKIRSQTNASFVVDKFLNNVMLLGLVRILFPSAPILLMQREPLDNALSMYQRLFTQGQLYCYDREELAIYMNHYALLCDFWAEHYSFYTVRYEALVSNIKEGIQYLVDSCGLTFQDNLLRFYESKRSVRTASLYQVRQPIYTKSVLKWASYEKLLFPTKEALEEKRLVPKNKDPIAELVNMGYAFAESDKHEQAVLLYEHALVLQKDHTQALLNRISSHIALSQLDEALKYLQKLPHSADSLFLYGVIHEEKHEWDASILMYTKALEENAEHEQSRFNLALIYQKRNQFDDAIHHFRALLQYNPTNWEALVGLGSICIAQEKYEEALGYYDEVFHNPNHPLFLQENHDLWPHAMEWGIVHRLLGHYPQSEKIFLELIALSPDNAKYLYQLGMLYEELGAWDIAVRHYEKALEQEDNHVIHSSLGALYKSMERYGEAEQHFVRAIQLEPWQTSAHNNLGNLYNTLGDFQRAEACYRKAIQEIPHFFDAYRHLAQVKKYQSVEDTDIVQWEQLLQEPCIQEEKKMQISFALGKAYDDAGAHAQSFSHLLVGNALKRKTFDFDLSREEKKVEGLIEYFTHPPPKGRGNPSDVPIFILGMPRSGTSLCEQILASHSLVYGGGELNAMGKVKSQIQRSTKLGFPYGLNELHEKEYSALGDLYLQFLSQVGTGRFITDKMPNNFMMIGLIRSILPNAKIIYCRRDPRDNGLSLFLRYFVGFHGYAYELKEIASYLVLHHKLMKHWLQIFSDSIFVLDYEEIVQDQARTTSNLLRYCGLSFEPALEEFYKTKRGVATASAMQVRNPVYRTSMQKWKRYEQELAPMIAVLQEAGLCLD